MLNYIWGCMIITGIIVSAFTGNIPLITSSSLESSKDAVSVIIQMTGIVAMWTGLMKIAEKAGIINSFSKKLKPVLKFLFPDVPENSKALTHISTNLIANMLGLGWAATPAGLMAMKELQKLNKNKKVASKSMCMFMIINMSSLQILSVSIISDRDMYNSANASEIIAPALIATIITAIVGVVAAKVLEGIYK